MSNIFRNNAQSITILSTLHFTLTTPHRSFLLPIVVYIIRRSSNDNCYGMEPIGVILTLLMGAIHLTPPSDCALVRQNVIFQKVKEIPATQNYWQITLVDNLSHYEQEHKRITLDMRHFEARMFGIGITNRFKGLRRANPLFRAIKEEFNLLKDAYRQFHTLSSRKRRSLLPFMGDIASFLFGTVSEEDLASIRRGLRILTRNQNTLVHALKDFHSIVNTSRRFIVENRRHLRNLTHDFESFKLESEMALDTVLALQIFSNNIRLLRQHILETNLIIDSLSVGHLTPSIISPSYLRRILLDIRPKLSAGFQFLQDPSTNIWYFYEHATCSSMFHNSLLIITFKIPLVETKQYFEVYKIHNLPFPNKNSSQPLVAVLDIKESALAISNDRSKYTTLSAEELNRCLDNENPSGTLTLPFYSVSDARTCSPHLFLDITSKINEFCITMVMTNLNLPLPIYVNKDTVAVATKNAFNVHIVCETSHKATVNINPPLCIFQLNRSCSATCEFFYLPPRYTRESTFHVPADNDPPLITSVFDNVSLWNDVWSRQSKHAEHMPPSLEEHKQIKMSDFVNELEEVDDDLAIDPFPLWIAIGCSIVLILSNFALLGWWSIGKQRRAKSHRINTSPTLNTNTINNQNTTTDNDVITAQPTRLAHVGTQA